MADNGIVIRWARPVAGREGHASELFNTFTTYLGKQQQQGNIENYEPVMLAPNGGPVGGYILVRGTRPALDKLSTSDDFLNLVTQATLVLKHVAIDHAYLGEALRTQMGRLQKYAPQARLEIK